MGQSVSRGPEAPESAKSQGGINQVGVTPEMRKQTPSRVLTEGPQKGERDNFLPAAYKIEHHIPQPNGDEKVFTMIREDH